jgi:aldose 1-epimerase
MENGAVRDLFGRMADGAPVERVVLTHESGIETAIITYGAAIQSLKAPDRNGRMDNIVLGHDDLASYLDHRNFFGAAIGRFANRIADGRFAIDGALFLVAANDGPNALHGGEDGFDRRNWTLEAFGTEPEPFAVYRLTSADGDQGFPGELCVRLRYSLTGDKSLNLSFEATTDRRTIVNLTHHGFFNLGGAGVGTILDHELTIFADAYLPATPSRIPAAGPTSVDSTPFDFRRPTAIGARIRDQHPQLGIGRGYDHNYCLSEARCELPRLVAQLYDPRSGRQLDLETDQPGVQFYAGGYLGDGIPVTGGRVPSRFGALCLEPQTWPDSPNHSGFPTALLDPGDKYCHSTNFHFSAR